MTLVSEWPVGPSSIRTSALRSLAAVSYISLPSPQSRMSQGVHVGCHFWSTALTKACLFHRFLPLLLYLGLQLYASCSCAGPPPAWLPALDKKASICTPALPLNFMHYLRISCLGNHPLLAHSARMRSPPRCSFLQSPPWIEVTSILP